MDLFWQICRQGYIPMSKSDTRYLEEIERQTSILVHYVDVQLARPTVRTEVVLLTVFILEQRS